MPASRTARWTAEIEGNRARDLPNESALLDLGWPVVPIWACALKTAAARERLEGRLEGLVGG